MTTFVSVTCCMSSKIFESTIHIHMCMQDMWFHLPITFFI